METGKPASLGDPKTNMSEWDFFERCLQNRVEVRFMDGTYYSGKLLGINKYTVILGPDNRDNSQRNRLIFKHAIKSIRVKFQ